MDRRTVDVYEEGATRWRDTRPARFIERAEVLGRSIPDGVPRLDAGCGAGLHLPVQADLEHLPFRLGALGGSWARASYLHVARTRLPWALMDLHASLEVDAPTEFIYRHGADRDLVDEDDDEFPGRFFAEWGTDALTDIHVGAGFEVRECTHDGGEWIVLSATRRRTLPDYVDAGMRLLMCGLNPSEYAADRGVGFARPGNRFWPAAIAAGIVSRDRDPRHALTEHGMGMTDLVKRATPRADSITADEYRDGVARVGRLVRWLRPQVICFAGLTGYRAAIDKRAQPGPLPDGFGGAAAYLMPNPSGVNAHVQVDVVAAHLRAAAALAG